MYCAKPHQPEPYDHRIRDKHVAQSGVVRGLKNVQFIRATTNREWLKTKPDRLRLMGEK
jgi:hypothetical protein